MKNFKGAFSQDATQREGWLLSRVVAHGTCNKLKVLKVLPTEPQGYARETRSSATFSFFCFGFILAIYCGAP